MALLSMIVDIFQITIWFAAGGDETEGGTKWR